MDNRSADTRLKSISTIFTFEIVEEERQASMLPTGLEDSMLAMKIDDNDLKNKTIPIKEVSRSLDLLLESKE